MSSSWTPERKARQSALIRIWQPWKQATGPRTPDGKATASRNAYKGGLWLMLRELARMVATAYAGAQFEITDAGLVVKPSPPHIARKDAP